VNRNVEIKARVRDADAFARRAQELAGRPPEVIVQRDVFFAVATGRLKLRLLDGLGELIAYDRPDAVGPRTSRYLVHQTDDPQGLLAVLSAALPAAGEVSKTRRLYLVGRTRVHLDEVEGLGTFMELEVVLGEDEPVAAGEAEARRLMDALGISSDDEVDVAYVDLLHRGGRPRS